MNIQVDPAHEEQVKLLDDIRGQADSFQRKVSSVEQELEGVEKVCVAVQRIVCYQLSCIVLLDV